MIRRVFSAIAVVALMSVAALAQDLTLDQVLKKAEDAIGGAEAISKVQTLKMTAKMTVSGQEMLMTVSTKRPSCVRTEMTIQGQSVVSAYDGTTGWMINPLTGSSEPQKMDDKTTASLSTSDMNNSLGSLSGLKAAGHTVELLGKEDVDGSPAYKVKVTLKSGPIMTYFLDTGTFLPIKIVSKISQMGQDVEVEGFPSNYKKVGGIMFAHSIAQKVGGRSLGQMDIEKIEIDTPMDDSIFKMPVKK